MHGYTQDAYARASSDAPYVSHDYTIQLQITDGFNHEIKSPVY